MDQAVGRREGGLHRGRLIINVGQRGDDVGAGHAIDADGPGKGGHQATADIAHGADDDDGHWCGP